MFKVLVIDDEEGVRIPLASFLEMEGYQAWAAENGFDAFEQIKANRPDFIISDVRMPIWDGFRLQESLNTLTPPIPILYISGFLGDGMESLKQGKGFVGIIAKPFKVDELLQIVKRFAEACHSPRTL
ncbi:MAG TPA: hypothetical protein DCS07_11735 [Bdellovibrionales bacterium]|nr:MAG: hypothetical protein A2Z97_14595 [Bdellovibrionales bacterium GWB1_52_6]OFZ04068.1 MAG: hypothetical protein A2X97_14800 [Bdellovibrionales bacterium GWA1_52_35]OFZ41239.1 MAG: hypothetical protein A2070_03930 [Bdellovibrionales bacterium GWC1_52_8]HAR43279.1 hypothetical protein [Bdellovibrionales bacterium]HCM39846.1 hypothetical protein [Bdellovibrionales bacterium]